MIDDHIRAQKDILEQIRVILVGSINEEYRSLEFHEELFDNSDRCTTFYIDKFERRKDIILLGIDSLDIMDLSFDLNEIMRKENPKGLQSFSLTYAPGHLVNIVYNYKH
jgi:hypothetical protein